ncbi:outer membrane protein assembly factor [Acinetobacter sp. KAM398]|uniref:autotransporter assembly complex protein TamA n=1 Tax=unclassified Acinetobacter TaxID=196816 RepID=UPI001F383B66|nr:MULTISPECIES: autotransporter assembly complex family protein [unclassified Acinetobacter]GJC31055.1 outer membrane protein assembly factor [Acinetobacter sp. KAM392]GJC33940.1 outer membrane protein assembly factor [Acinetobacter sp. KAM393]GJC36769.1 outer membrane protein assembly factor [Acinetobacter sp. KAM394]GJC39512.1 outer membrane protein assembly factor [Acinetobacter sp. KAM395]GJC42494.1 outer membrane protein assembly factor [Acinetobacter sp. KAM396]
MLVNTNFKKSVLCSSMHAILCWNMPKKLGLSLFLGLVASSSFAESLKVPNSNTQLAENRTLLQTPTAEEAQNLAEEIKQLAAAQGKDSAEDLQKIEEALEQTQTPEFNSLEMLKQQQQAGASFAEFQPIEFEDLEDLPIAPVDQQLANEIFQVAQQAKQEAMLDRNGQEPETLVQDATQQEVLQIDQAPVNIDQLMTSIQADRNFVVEANPSDTLTELGWMTQVENADKPGFFRRLLYKVRPPRELNTAKVPRISADVVITANSANGTQDSIGQVSPNAYRTAVDQLSANIKAKLSSFTQESFADFPSALPQLRTLSNQAAQAVGFYNAEFKFEKLSESRVRVHVVPNPPVAIKQQNIEFTGEGQYEAQFQVIGVLPDQEVDDVFNHGLYEQTKKRITDAASDNGYFDSYWRLHDVKVAQPQNTADINLRYETGERYKLGNVEFRMSDPNQEFPLDMDILQSLVTWQDNADYTFWRVNGLANNLTNSRYFNYTLVDTIRPDPVEHPLELPPDIQALVDQQKLSIYEATAADQKRVVSSQEVTQSVVNEAEFAGTEEGTSNDKLRILQAQQEDKQSEEERLKQQARIDKKIPVIVTLNADRLNSAEVGAGFGTDTGVRLRGQYRRAIVNKRGHSFDANLELSQIRQAIDGRYNIPYNHPLNDYVALVGGYEREERDDVAQGGGLMIESAVAGVDRVIKKPMGSWQHTFGLRYRLDRLTEDGTVFLTKPDAFIANGDVEQQSLLLGYEVSRTDSNRRVNPSKGFRQIYKVELGSESLLSDADLAILNAGWRFIYSLGENDDHQFVGRSDLGYIYTEDFNKVPYNLRYFTGGDQSLRGFDYKSLSPQIEGFKIGGQALAVGSLEYNYQFKEGWRAAVFSDFGNAYDKDFSNDPEYSVGLGVRWASPIGPIRIDVASGISDDNHPIRLHFFIGSQL